MTLNLAGQYLELVLASILIFRLIRLRLSSRYSAFLVFVTYDSLQSLIYLAALYLEEHGVRVIDYRVLWCSLRLIAWITVIWVVYSLLILILRQLPGILRFSIRLLNGIFAVSIIISLFTIRPEYTASGYSADPDWRVRMSVLALVMERTLSFASLLSILAILTFVLFFPISVPRNLAYFATGLSAYLCLTIAGILSQTYFPAFYARFTTDPLPFVMLGCLTFWIFNVSTASEKASATLGRGWQSVPQEHLVRQLEAMNTALLRSREQS